MAPSEKIEYSVVEGWEQLPKGYVHRDVAGVAVDGEDRVYLICRGDRPVIIHDQQGNFQRSWGEPGRGPGQFHLPHGIAIDSEGRVFVCEPRPRARGLPHVPEARP